MQTHIVKTQNIVFHTLKYHIESFLFGQGIPTKNRLECFAVKNDFMQNYTIQKATKVQSKTSHINLFGQGISTNNQL